MNPQIIGKKKCFGLGFIFLTFFVLTLSGVFAQADYLIESTNITVYRDGVVHVSQNVIINETYPVMNLQLFSSTVDNMIIVDTNRDVLDYKISEYNLTIFTLGTNRVNIEYDTISLTNKEAEVWTLNVENPNNSTVYLPKDATIVYLNKIPFEIETLDNKITLSIFPDFWEISYILPLGPPAEPPDPPQENIFPLEYIAIAIGLTVLLLVFLFIKRRQPNIKKIVKKHPQLKNEEIDVIRFIKEEGGKVFESQIRERFPDLPRTSLWRLIRRLEKNEIVRTKKIGLENQVELKK